MIDCPFGREIFRWLCAMMAFGFVMCAVQVVPDADKDFLSIKKDVLRVRRFYDGTRGGIR